VAGGVLAITPAGARADGLTIRIPPMLGGLPQVVHLDALGDLNCVGIKLKDWDPYDGRCRLGAPVGAMQGIASLMPPKQLKQQLPASSAA
jgi:hypothetical protein